MNDSISIQCTLHLPRYIPGNRLDNGNALKLPVQRVHQSCCGFAPNLEQFAHERSSFRKEQQRGESLKRIRITIVPQTNEARFEEHGNC